MKDESKILNMVSWVKSASSVWKAINENEDLMMI